MKIKALLERVHSNWDASVTADQTILTSLQLLFLLTNLKPTTKISELRVDQKYSLLGQRCAMAHSRLAAHQGSNWRRIVEPVLGAGVNITEESVQRVALECGWQSTRMTEEVTTYAQHKAAARRQSADETQGRLSFTQRPAPAVAPTGPPLQGRVPDAVVSDALPTGNDSQAGTGEQGRVPIQQPPSSPRAASRSDPSQAANDGSQAAGVGEQGRVPTVVQEGRVPVDRNAHSVDGSVAEQEEISPNQEEVEVASAPEPDELSVLMELDTSGNSEPTAGADMFAAAKSKAKAKPRAKGKSKAKAKAMATALSDEVDVEGQAEDQTEANDVIPGLTEEDQVEGQAEDQTEANDVIPGLTEDVANEPVSPPNRWNQDICVICHGEMNQDQAGLFHVSLFNEPLIIVTVHSTYYVTCLFICFHGMQALEALVCGHLFHRDCINRYCDTTGRDKANACPLKCSSSSSTRFFLRPGQQAARGSNDPAPVQDDADVNGVNELINEIEAQIVDDSTHRERAEAIDPVVD